MAVLRIASSFPAPECCHPSGKGRCGAVGVLLFGRGNTSDVPKKILLSKKVRCPFYDSGGMR